MNSGSKTRRLDEERETLQFRPKALDDNAPPRTHVDGANGKGEAPATTTQPGIGTEAALPSAVRSWLSPEPVRHLAPGQDYVDGVLYYHLDAGEEQVFLTSRREVVGPQELPAGLHPPSGMPPCPRVSGEAVQRLLAGEACPNAATVHDRVLDFVARFISFADEAQADLVAVWLMHTYLFRAFRHTPYLQMRGEPGSSPSILAEILACLAWQGELHRILTHASVMAEAGRGTAVFDLADAGAPPSEAVLDILATGSSASGETVRLGDEGRVFRRTAYSPRAFAGTGDPGFLAGSPVRIDLLPPDPDEELVRFRPGAVADELGRLLDDLHLFALSSAADVAAISENDLAPAPDRLPADKARLWEPLLALAVLVDQQDGSKGVCRRVSRLAVSVAGETRGGEGLPVRLLRLVGEIVDTGEPKPIQGCWYGARQVLRVLTETDEVPELAHVTDLTVALSRLGIRGERRFFPKLKRYERCYELDPGKLADLRDRFRMRYVPGAHAGAARGRRPHDRQEVA